ncbi:hypothetical protein SFR_3740 [Streptomyces sp. FR-008]|nr:hypothetical protein SFR_3740 [Streptomyces sp. FR-008]
MHAGSPACMRGCPGHPVRSRWPRGCLTNPVRCPRCPVRALGAPDEGPRSGATWAFGRCGESACRAPRVPCGICQTPPALLGPRAPRGGVGVRLTARALADAGSTGEAFGVYVTITGRMRLYVRGNGFPGSPAPGRPQPER